MKTFVIVANTCWNLFNFRLGLMREMRDRGWKVVGIAPADEWASRLEGEGFTLHHVVLDRSGINPFRDVGYFLSLYRLYRKIRPDIVHHFTIKPIVYGSMAANLSGVKGIVSTITGLGYGFYRRSLLRYIVHILYRISTWWSQSHIIFQNSDDLEYFLVHGIVRRQRAHLIYGSGVDIVRFSPVGVRQGDQVVRNPVLTVLFAGRLLWDKGVREYVTAAENVRHAYPKVRFIIIGWLDSDNPSAVAESWLRAKVSEGVVEWLGRIPSDKMHLQVAACHIVVLPSYREGIPRILLEGGALEKALIATDTTGCRDVVVHNETGLLVPVGDSTALAAAIEYLVERPAERLRLGKTARCHIVARFDEKIIVSQILQIYESLV